MKQTALILAIMALIATAHAADIDVPLASITVPDAAVSDIVAWLDTQNIYTTETTIETRTDPDTGESVDIAHTTQVVVPETPKAKLTRIAGAAARQAIRQQLEQFRQARADAEAKAAMDALADPVAE